MQFHDKLSLARVRFEHAQECLCAAEELLSTGQYKSAANRLYYAVFHSMRSVLAFDGVDMKHHSGVIAEFRRKYIKTAVFEKSLSDTISAAFDMRTGCDYDDFYLISKNEVCDLIEDVRTFLDAIAKFIDDMQYNTTV